MDYARAPMTGARTLLVANRGEIAVRIFATARRLGLRTAAVAGPGDEGALHTRVADVSVPVASYLDADALVVAAGEADADLVHPGYGFLSERAAFAEAVLAAGLTWVGPSPAALRSGGDKLEAKRIAAAAGVPTLPTGGPEELGFPLLVKAAAGGGGRGMRVVRSAGELDEALAAARREAEAAFGDGTVFLERYLERPRHVEIQLLADAHGTVLALGERECSIQRRHQKLVEESPSPVVTDQQRAEISAALRKAVAAAGYTNAGTVEFLMDENGKLYFIEVNARIQVEHPVTEFVTGVDLVKSQIRIAQGEPLSEIVPGPVELRGHAIECRVNAENPETFVPSPGRITGFHVPGGIGVRVDTWAYTDCVIPPYYDSLIAKLIAYGSDRGEAIRRMQRALGMFIVEGIYTSIPLHQRILDDPDFQAGRFDTNFIKRFNPAPKPGV